MRNHWVEGARIAAVSALIGCAQPENPPIPSMPHPSATQTVQREGRALSIQKGIERFNSEEQKKSHKALISMIMLENKYSDKKITEIPIDEVGTYLTQVAEIVVAGTTYPQIKSGQLTTRTRLFFNSDMYIQESDRLGNGVIQEGRSLTVGQQNWDIYINMEEFADTKNQGSNIHQFGKQMQRVYKMVSGNLQREKITS